MTENGGGDYPVPTPRSNRDRIEAIDERLRNLEARVHGPFARLEPRPWDAYDRRFGPDGLRPDGGREGSGGDRPEPKTREHPDGVTVNEAGDCRFVASPSGTVHERREWPGDAHDYDYYPKCGQRLPAGSMWGRVDAENPREAVTKYDLKPCGKCFKHTHELRKLRRLARREHRSLSTASSREDAP